VWHRFLLPLGYWEDENDDEDEKEEEGEVARGEQ
jgi:hypothetical protein